MTSLEYPKLALALQSALATWREGEDEGEHDGDYGYDATTYAQCGGEGDTAEWYGDEVWFAVFEEDEAQAEQFYSLDSIGLGEKADLGQDLAELTYAITQRRLQLGKDLI